MEVELDTSHPPPDRGGPDERGRWAGSAAAAASIFLLLRGATVLPALKKCNVSW